MIAERGAEAPLFHGCAGISRLRRHFTVVLRSTVAHVSTVKRVSVVMLVSGCGLVLAAEHFSFLGFFEERLPFILQGDAGATGEGLGGFEGLGCLFAIAGLQGGLREFDGGGELAVGEGFSARGEDWDEAGEQ